MINLSGRFESRTNAEPSSFSFLLRPFCAFFLVNRTSPSAVSPTSRGEDLTDLDL